MNDAPSEPVDEPVAGTEPDDHDTSSLKGTFTAVMLMAAFFVATWVGMFLLAMERR